MKITEITDFKIASTGFENDSLPCFLYLLVVRACSKLERRGKQERKRKQLKYAEISRQFYKIR